LPADFIADEALSSGELKRKGAKEQRRKENPEVEKPRRQSPRFSIRNSWIRTTSFLLLLRLGDLGAFAVSLGGLNA
jgi:hypothetical protein